ncbi:XRE family transcriptional regulator [Candidatus Magnetobacterium bavaricum]|uniref:XRE family transcriptional regulator n=1 Tax=Candidatus Magnetobacterium bavaricum TaxID=29290 RepID=A0A0F3GXV1_9BACT|nr:XRE family transcriptional regulator [Candidatus Magnetobacterium bavaricum]
MKTTTHKNIADAIKRYREEIGLHQRDLGIAIGFKPDLAQTRISAYENGRRSPGKKTLEKIASVLKRKPEDFYGSTSHPLLKCESTMTIETEDEVMLKTLKSIGIENSEDLNALIKEFVFLKTTEGETITNVSKLIIQKMKTKKQAGFPVDKTT